MFLKSELRIDLSIKGKGLREQPPESQLIVVTCRDSLSTKDAV